MVSKFMDVGRDVTFQANQLVAADVAVVTARILGAKASDNKTDLAVVEASAFAEFTQLSISAGSIDAAALQKAKVLLPGLKNTALSRIFGAGNWQTLFDDATPNKVVLPALGGPRGPADPFVGTKVKASVPVINGSDVDIVVGVWEVL